MRKWRARLGAALLCCVTLFSGCGTGSAGTADSAFLPDASLPDSAAEVQQEEPAAYSGPLYEVSVEKITDKLPDFERFPCGTATQQPFTPFEVRDYVENNIGIPVEQLYSEFGAELAEWYKIKNDQDYAGEVFDHPEDYLARMEAEDQYLEQLVERISACAAGWKESHPDSEYDEERIRYHVEHMLNYMADRFDISRPAYICFYQYSNSGDFIRYIPGRDADGVSDNNIRLRGFLTNSRLEQFSELDQYVFLGTTAGRTVFYDETQEQFLFTDNTGAILYTLPENMSYVSGYIWSPEEYFLGRYAREGMFPFIDENTGCYGYLNLEDFTVFELEPEYSLVSYTRNGEEVTGIKPIELTFREGKKPVIYSESTDTCYKLLGDGFLDSAWAELDVAGYIDKNGEFVFRFCDVPDFEGQIVIRAGDYVNDTAIVQCRPRGQSSGLRGSYFELFQGTYYEIDTEGNILRESNGEEYDHHDETGGERLETYDGRYRIGTADPISTERILLTDDLVLYRNAGTGGFEMTDVNGTVYPLETPEAVDSVQVMGNGLVVLSVVVEGDGPGTSAEQMRYYVRYEDIRPADFTAGLTDFEPDTLCVSDYYALPE